MDDSVQLGGNIELKGVENIDRSSMVVLKKIIGSYVRKFAGKGIEKLSVSFADKKISVEAVAQGNVHSSMSDHSNLFFGIDAALKEIERKL